MYEIGWAGQTTEIGDPVLSFLTRSRLWLRSEGFKHSISSIVLKFANPM